MYKRIVNECYFISHNINTSYTDLMNITPTERKYMLEFLDAERAEDEKRNEEFKKRLEERRAK